MRRKKQLKNKDEKIKQGLKLKAKIKSLLNCRLSYRVFKPIKKFKEWLNSQSVFKISIMILVIVIAINIIFNSIFPKYEINSQNLSFLKSKEFRSTNAQALIIVWLAYKNFLVNVWTRYRKKPLGRIMR